MRITAPSRRGTGRADLLAALAAGAVIAATIPVATGAPRSEAMRTASLVNLRELGTAHRTYAAEWNDRQWTRANDTLATYGDSPEVGWRNFGRTAEGETEVPGPMLGLDHHADEGVRMVHADLRLREPILFDVARGDRHHAMGSFRLINALTFNHSVNGRVSDEAFFAPDDHLAHARLRGATGGPNVLAAQDPFMVRRDAEGRQLPPVWSSYVMSPAAMMNPQVMAARRTRPGGEAVGGWRSPWSFAGGFRSPAMGQARSPELKTLMIERDWLGARPSGVHPEAGPAACGRARPGCRTASTPRRSRLPRPSGTTGTSRWSPSSEPSSPISASARRPLGPSVCGAGTRPTARTATPTICGSRTAGRAIAGPRWTGRRASTS